MTESVNKARKKFIILLCEVTEHECKSANYRHSYNHINGMDRDIPLDQRA